MVDRLSRFAEGLLHVAANSRLNFWSVPPSSTSAPPRPSRSPGESGRAARGSRSAPRPPSADWLLPLQQADHREPPNTKARRWIASHRAETNLGSLRIEHLERLLGEGAAVAAICSSSSSGRSAARPLGRRFAPCSADDQDDQVALVLKAELVEHNHVPEVNVGAVGSIPSLIRSLRPPSSCAARRPSGSASTTPVSRRRSCVAASESITGPMLD